MKIHLVMPMAGKGQRFFDTGYCMPKPLIEIAGRPFFYWSAMSILKDMDVQDLTFIVLQNHIINNHIDEVIKHYFPTARIESIPDVLPGPVYTSLKGTENIQDDLPIVFNDCDHMFRCRKLSIVLRTAQDLADAYLLTFESQAPQYSYVAYSNTGKLKGTVEKKVVSNHAICGAYVFKNIELFRSCAQKYILDCPYNETYMSGIYNVMCNENKDVRDLLLDFHVEFGTPEEYENATKSRYFEELNKL